MSRPDAYYGHGGRPQQYEGVHLPLNPLARRAVDVVPAELLRQECDEGVVDEHAACDAVQGAQDPRGGNTPVVVQAGDAHANPGAEGHAQGEGAAGKERGPPAHLREAEVRIRTQCLIHKVAAVSESSYEPDLTQTENPTTEHNELAIRPDLKQGAEISQRGTEEEIIP